MAIKYTDIKQFNKVMLIYNRNSGKQLFASMNMKINEIFKHLKAFLGTEKVELCEVHRFPELEGLVARVVQEKIDWVIIAGGDGTIRAAIEKLADKKYLPYISIIPAGTVNLVAKELLISNEPHKWVRRILKGIEQQVYLGRCNGHVFLTVAGIGFDSLVVDNVSELEKKLLNKMAYAWEGAEMIRKEMLFRNWQYRFKVRFDEEEEWYEVASVIVGKSRYYAGRYNLFRHAALDKPLLYVAGFKGATRADFASYATCIALESLALNKNIVVRTASKLEIVCEQGEFAAELDGDAITSAPLKIELDEEPVKFLA